MKRILSVSFVVLGALLVLALTGCDDLFLETETKTVDRLSTYSVVQGSVVNALAEGAATEYWKGSGNNTLADAVVRFYQKQATGLYSSTPAYTATVDSHGRFVQGKEWEDSDDPDKATLIMDRVTGGQYKIQGVKDGWSFVPMEVTVAGATLETPPMIAYENEDVYSLTILLEWQDESIDLDAYLTYYTGSGDTRGKVWHGNKDGTAQGLDIKLHRDVTVGTLAGIPRVETITVRDPENTPADWFSNDLPGERDDIPDDELRFYVNNFTRGNTSLTGEPGKKSASARVHLMLNQGGNEAGEHYGTWVLPWNTGEDTLQIFTLTPAFEGPDPKNEFEIFTQTRWVESELDDETPRTPIGIRSLSLSPHAVDRIR
ncbi:hypothetical protein SAMN05920897_101313 [Alkalispirochaeta americana]|uniref:Uncharacterized protein n=1 Tax=Alkalispirochaeta americana TaxID=159291 RepID=A0A1N6NL47_9SPIO|nr:hypothetical protein [Alkalispirochaeta americana]SIP92859.1 hypothetical protein SAMN05920897_101313 [Alkalispirochaeta americana]